MLQGQDKMRVSQADLVLVGHEEEAKFAVAISSAEPLVASGGDDTEVHRGLIIHAECDHFCQANACRIDFLYCLQL